jgi:hypothetical protein
VLVFVTAVSVFCLFQIIRGKGRPEEIVLPARSPPKVFGLLPLLLALFFLFRFGNDTSSYWRLAAALFWLLLGGFALLGPSYSELGDSHRVRLGRSMAKAWWVMPSALVGFGGGFLVLTFRGPDWAASAFATACLVGFSAAITWSFFRLRRALREQSG